MIVKVVREKAINGAIPSKVYVNDGFFCYGLENENYKIPSGKYDAYGMTSPKFGTEKIYLNVPNRSGILFHGANNAEQLKGCIGVGKNRDGATISGDCSDELFKQVDSAYKRGEKIAVVVSDSTDKMAVFLTVAGIVAAFFMLRKG